MEQTVPQLRLGVCCMERKLVAQPMQELLHELRRWNDMEICLFNDIMILDTPWQQWPVCHLWISFHAEGFPLKKVMAYVDHYQPIVVNDVRMQEILLNRRMVFDLCTANGIPTPPHICVRRDEQGNILNDVQITNESVEAHGKRITKPFVEKPEDAEDHNVFMYYASSQGGGGRRLFRKVGDRSSEFDSDLCRVRENSTYIYEEFVPVARNMDIKVYMVGVEYIYAERRRSPLVDGKVERLPNGREKRYTVELTSCEREIAAKIYATFRQLVCGFDLLRIDENRSVVCDINGWNFVKNNTDYPVQCARVIHDQLIAHAEKKNLI